MNKYKLRKEILALTMIGILNSGVVGMHADAASAKDTKVELNTNKSILDNLEIKREFKVVATDSVNVRIDSTVDSKKLGTLNVGDELTWLGLKVDGWYQVMYNDSIGYVKGDYVTELTTYEALNAEPIDLGYTSSEARLIIPAKVSIDKHTGMKILPENTFCEILDETKYAYLVSTDDYIGYINKKYMTTLDDTYVVVDLSDQQLSLYVDDLLDATFDVVTGKPSTPSDEGVFEVYSKTYNRDLVGPGYRSYVNYMFAYNGGEGLHDAEIWTDENGKKHGWRSEDEFGGDTYLTDGSHGCVNMKHDDVAYLDDYVKVGTKVIVKK